MMLTDTHTHLYSEDFDADREEQIQNALKADIGRFFIPAIDSATLQAMYHLEEKYAEHVFLMMGLHPTHVQPDNYREELALVKRELENHQFYAIGEIGIDLHWDKSTLHIQQQAFREQIQWAKKLGLPIVIHCRDAFDEVFEILEEEKGEDLFGIFHCFTGTLEQARRAISYNLKLGIGGIVTFKNGKIDRFLKEIPIENIVLETDAPYLAPTPYRGKRNNPVYLKKVAEKVAQIYDISLNRLAEITTQNSKDIFGV